MRETRLKYFLLYANCIPVKGAKRSIICDLQLGRYKFIPNILFEILTKHRNFPLEKIKKSYNHTFDRGIDTYLKLLTDDEWGFYTNDPDVFPKMDLKWDFPGLISNAIIDVDKDSNHNYNTIFDQLDSLGCTALQIRFLYNIDLVFLEKILNRTNNGNLSYIEIYLKYNSTLQISEIKKILIKNIRVRLIYIYGAGKNELIEFDSNLGRIFFIRESISFSSHCGYVNDDYFQVNVSLFTESQKFNTCLNRKVTIDYKGQIKNCPYTNETYGNINEIKL